MRSSLHRSGNQGRLVLVLVASVVLAACQSDEEKIATFMENGETYVDEGNHAEAVIEYRNVLQLDPNNADAHFEVAKSYLVLGKGREAYWEFTETVRLNPDLVEARLSKGGLALIAKDYPGALEQGEAIIELEPENGNAYVMRAQALEQLERSDEAEAPYLKAISLEPDNGIFLLVTAGYYVRQNDRPKAEPLLVKNAEQDPSFQSYTALARFLTADRQRKKETISGFEAALETADNPKDMLAGTQNLANILFVQEQKDRALEVLNSGIDKSESADKVELLYQLARLHQSMGNTEKADEIIESTVVAQPDAVQPRLVLSAYRGRQGDLEGALEAAEAALKIDATDPKAMLRKAELLVDMGYRGEDEAQINEGLELVEQVLVDEPTNPDALFVKGKVYLAQKQPDEAVKSLRSALDSRPDWAQAHFVLGSALTLEGDQSGARASVARAVELDPSLLEARRLLAKLHAGLGEHEYAVEQGRIYLRNKPNHVETRILVAQSLVRLGRREDAMRSLDRIAEDAGGTDVLFAKGRLYQAAGETEKAYEYLERANESKPNHPEILRSLLGLDRRNDRLADSQERIAAAFAAEPDNAELARLNGTLAMASGDLEGAESSLKRAIELDQGNLAAYEQLATLYQATGRLEETLDVYKKAIEQRPDSAKLHHFLAVLYEMGGKIDIARAEYEKAVELDETLGQAKNNLAYLMAESGEELDRALSLAQEAKALMPDSPNAADTLGWVLYKRGISSAAVGYLKEAVATMDQNSPNLGVVQHHLALAYEANNQQDEAISTLELALAGLEQQRAEAQKQGARLQDREWSGQAREMLTRLKPAG